MNLIRFHPEAEKEMTHAAGWYERQQKHLGKRFLTSVQDAVLVVRYSEPVACVDIGLRLTS